jgi:fluoroquinolone transport system permease protein
MKQDAMLTIIVFVPFVTGIVFKLAVPVAENLLTDHFSTNTILSPYYELFDLLLIILTPGMLNCAAAMVMLEEADDYMTAYLAVTPLGRLGYLISRLGAANLMALPLSVALVWFFRVSDITVLMLIGAALSGTMQGMAVAFLIVSLSANKVEGMAAAKMSALFNLGILAPYFLKGKVQYFLSVFPSFWMAQAVHAVSWVSLAVSILLAILWIALLFNKFKRKIS